MDFKTMTDSEFYCYKNAVKRFLNNFDLKNEGVVFAMLEEFPELDEKLSHLSSTGEVELSEKLCADFRDACIAADQKFMKRFNVFFETCVSDVNMEEDLLVTLGSSKNWVRAFSAPSDEVIDEYENQADEKQTAAAQKQNISKFKQILKESCSALKNVNIGNLEQVVQASHERSYS